MNMRAVVVLTFCLILTQNVSGSEGGINEETDFEDSGIVFIETDNYVVAKENFGILIGLDNATSENGTSLIWVTQICINIGVCYPPQNNHMDSNDNGSSWTSSIIVDDDASYVNWRIKMNWSDGEETTIPESGFGWKVWSNCWFDGEEWGGADTTCQSDEENNILPGFEFIIAIIAIMVAVMITRRN